jgi:hypothetical protein
VIDYEESYSMLEELPDDIKEELAKACVLHQRATSDYEKCVQFSRLMSDLLARLEDAGCNRTADKVMGILLECNPREGAHCESSVRVGEKMKSPLFCGKS